MFKALKTKSKTPNTNKIFGILNSSFVLPSSFRLRASRYAATRGSFVIRISGRIPPTEHTLLIHRGMTDGSDMRPDVREDLTGNPFRRIMEA